MKLKLNFFVLSLLLLSCKNEIKEIHVSDEIRANATAYVDAQAQIQAQAQQNMVSSSQVASNPSSVASNVLLNPPHGQPGHRCEIPVGAPLNGTSATNTTISQPVVEQQVITQNVTTPSTSNTTAPGFSGKPNPPHGQPGHRCDISVGAILP